MANQKNDDDDGRITFEIDPEKKRKFKAFVALKDTTQKDYLTQCVDVAIESIEKKRR